MPGPRELLALHEISDDVFFAYSSAGPDAVGGASGDSVNVRFSEAQAHRAASRARRYVTTTRLLATDDDDYQLEKFFARRFDEYSHTLGKATFLVLGLPRAGETSGLPHTRTIQPASVTTTARRGGVDRVAARCARGTARATT